MEERRQLGQLRVPLFCRHLRKQSALSTHPCQTFSRLWLVASSLQSRVTLQWQTRLSGPPAHFPLALHQRLPQARAKLASPATLRQAWSWKGVSLNSPWDDGKNNAPHEAEGKSVSRWEVLRTHQGPGRHPGVSPLHYECDLGVVPTQRRPHLR